MNKTAADVKGISGMEPLASALESVIERLEEASLYMAKTARSEKMMNAFAAAYPFMEVTGDVVMAWMLLWRAGVAARALENGAKKKDQAFYDGQIKSARFFIHSLLPVTLGKIGAILAGDGAVVEIAEDAFGSK
jgi:hypothetical protein